MGWIIDGLSGLAAVAAIFIFLGGLCVLGVGVTDESLLWSAAGIGTSLFGVGIFVGLRILKRFRGKTECEKRGVTYG